MSATKRPRNNRKGSSTRLTLLLVLLLIVGLGCAYEFGVARPNYQKAWEAVKVIDNDSDPSNFTSEDIDEAIGQEAFKTDDSLREDCIVKTYRWQSGLLVKNHDIHIVFTKFSPLMIKRNPELEDIYHYYSAVAGQPLDPKLNFPIQKETIVQNLNPPPVNMGGG